MAFAPLALKVPIIIENAEVVSKSYLIFGRDLKFLDFSITELKAYGQCLRLNTFSFAAL
jgi:3-phosphoshikimate 1-carboxyvinyltransferase